MAFRRRKNEDVTEVEQEELTETPDLEEVLAEVSVEEIVDDGSPRWPTGQIRERDGGPWDSLDAPEDKLERVDLGGVRIPIVNGMELRAELAEEQVVAVTLIIERSALQIQPFAAPRTLGIWDEVRAEIAEGIAQSGGTATEEEGRFGTELIAEVGVALPDGTTGMQTARFIGVDGPRWFLRAVITGEASVDAALRRPLEDLLADVVVVRGEDAMAPRDPIGLALPEEIEVGEPGEQFELADGDGGDDDEDEETDRPARVEDFNPFERGPEITEVR